MSSRYSICIGQDTVTIKGHMTIREAFDFLNFYDREGFKCITYPKERTGYDDDDDLEDAEGTDKVCFCITKKDLCGEYSYKSENSKIEDLQYKLDHMSINNRKLSDKIKELQEEETYKELNNQIDENKALHEKLVYMDRLIKEEVGKMVGKLSSLTMEVATLQNENKRLKLELNPEFQKIIQGENK